MRVWTTAGVALVVVLAAAVRGEVTQLTDASFDTEVAQGSAAWIVDVGSSAPDAARQQRLTELSDAMQGSGLRVGFVDRSKDKQCAAGASAGLLLYGLDRNKPVTLAPARGSIDAARVAEKALDSLRAGVLKRLGKKEKKQEKPKASSSSSDKPLELTDKTFDDVIGGSDDAFMVAFIAPWCGHCKALHPEWDQAAKDLADTGVVVARVDATANEALARRFQIQGFPTIKFFPPGAGNKADGDAIDYQQARTAQAITQWSLAEFERRGGRVSVNVPQMTSQDVLEEHCGKRGRCVLAFLPPLLDSGKAGREAMIEALQSAQREARHVRFLWVEAGAQPEWERTYNLEFGWPAVLLLRRHSGDELAAVMRGGGAFTGPALAAFASAAKKLGDFEAGGWPGVVETEEWDGEEAAPIQEEDDDDFDLEEFMSDD